MPREVVWLPDAARDVQRLREFIQQNNPEAARHAATRIREALQILINNPVAGSPVEEVWPFRDLVVSFGSGNYILRYREDATRVVIVRVRHSREDGF